MIWITPTAIGLWPTNRWKKPCDSWITIIAWSGEQARTVPGMAGKYFHKPCDGSGEIFDEGNRAEICPVEIKNGSVPGLPDKP